MLGLLFLSRQSGWTILFFLFSWSLYFERAFILRSKIVMVEKEEKKYFFMCSLAGGVGFSKADGTEVFLKNKEGMYLTDNDLRLIKESDIIKNGYLYPAEQQSENTYDEVIKGVNCLSDTDIANSIEEGAKDKDEFVEILKKITSRETVGRYREWAKKLKSGKKVQSIIEDRYNELEPTTTVKKVQ
jgi:hypothetical protein